MTSNASLTQHTAPADAAHHAASPPNAQIAPHVTPPVPPRAAAPAVTAPHAPGTITAFLYDWQGLETGAIAILAAVIGALVLNHQTRQNRRHKEDEDARRLRAARTALPLTLASLSEYAEQSAAYLAQHYGMTRVRGGGCQAPSAPPAIPAEAIPALERLAQAGSDALAECISDLLGDLQIFAARMRKLTHGSNGPLRPLAEADARAYVIDIATVGARVASLFDYGRRRSEKVPSTPSWDDVWTTLTLMGFDEDQNKALYTVVKDREERGARVGHMAKDETLGGS